MERRGPFTYDYPNKADPEYGINLTPIHEMLIKHGHLRPDSEMYKCPDPLFYAIGFNDYENTVDYDEEQLTPWAQRCADCGEAYHQHDLFDDPADPGFKICEHCFPLSAVNLLEMREESPEDLQTLTPEGLRVLATMREVYVTHRAALECCRVELDQRGIGWAS